MLKKPKGNDDEEALIRLEARSKKVGKSKSIKNENLEIINDKSIDGQMYTVNETKPISLQPPLQVKSDDSSLNLNVSMMNRLIKDAVDKPSEGSNEENKNSSGNLFDGVNAASSRDDPSRKGLQRGYIKRELISQSNDADLSSKTADNSITRNERNLLKKPDYKNRSCREKNRLKKRRNIESDSTPRNTDTSTPSINYAELNTENDLTHSSIHKSERVQNARNNANKNTYSRITYTPSDDKIYFARDEVKVSAQDNQDRDCNCYNSKRTQSTASKRRPLDKERLLGSSETLQTICGYLGYDIINCDENSIRRPGEEAKKMTKKEKIAQQTGKAIMTGLKYSWRLFVDGLMALSGPLAYVDITGGVSKVWTAKRPNNY